mmetsp:Transcript_8434/g.12464  ORF Transcript_8434/g.12464 Transcript_8434/m.12464 type:complete len:87 (-) Transcript_8434:9-269(-)
MVTHTPGTYLKLSDESIICIIEQFHKEKGNDVILYDRIVFEKIGNDVNGQIKERHFLINPDYIDNIHSLINKKLENTRHREKGSDF